MLFTKALSLGNLLCAIPNQPMLHSAESRLPAIPHNAELGLPGIAWSFYKQIQRRLHAMQLNVKFNTKCSGRLCAMLHSAESALRYVA
jgi:hypothetical protein